MPGSGGGSGRGCQTAHISLDTAQNVRQSLHSVKGQWAAEEGTERLTVYWQWKHTSSLISRPCRGQGSWRVTMETGPAETSISCRRMITHQLKRFTHVPTNSSEDNIVAVLGPLHTATSQSRDCITHTCTRAHTHTHTHTHTPAGVEGVWPANWDMISVGQYQVWWNAGRERETDRQMFSVCGLDG